MQVKDLIDKLSNYDLESEIVLMVKTKRVTIGPNPKAQIKGVMPGFDWDSGYTFIVAEDDIWVK